MNKKVNKKAALRNCNTEKPRKGKIRSKQEEGRGGHGTHLTGRKAQCGRETGKGAMAKATSRLEGLRCQRQAESCERS